MQLNLPSFDVRVRRKDASHDEIFDRLRRRYVALTPEEWVRQHFVNYLVEDLGYPMALMANEVSLEYKSRRRLC